jgi:LPXTG-site transpeptidase (sortase) family protein
MSRLRKIAVLLVLILAAPAAYASDGRPAAGRVIGWIAIPSIGLRMPIVEGPKDSVSEDGFYPTHYRSTGWTCEGQTVAISAHHFTHHSSWETGGGGPFRYIERLPKGAEIDVKMGGCTVRYRVTGQRWFYCQGKNFACPAASRGFTKIAQDKLILTTCIGDGSYHRFVYAFPVKHQL